MTAMTPSDVSGQLGIKPSTLRKYSLLLEEQGVPFERNANNSRKYSDMHFIALQKMITLMNNGGVSVEDAVFTASKWFIGDEAIADNNDDTNNGVERHNDDVAAAMISEIRSLKEEIKEQREVIDGFRLAQEKRDTYFVEILEQLQNEIQQLNERALPEPEEEEFEEITEEKQEEPPAESEKKKGFFSRFFK